ncbi:hypothetical protein [Reinekea blandensis]|uniref:VWFA domain-containing protein n=1 Tax=Reinekea blandensis MED297 TaxID=314283 RepID=A4BAW3_9GAMM|nr:hypothetical protein [Reinekea blandensis]EAR10576.1 hypothetical protein MED297_11190 [Reinekea sp. MED297] [Reinekea blandensis MED297]
MNKLTTLIVAGLATVLVGCEKDALHEEQQTRNDVGSRSVILPADFDVTSVNGDKSFFYFGKDSAQGRSTNVSTRATASYYDIAGIMVERDLETNEEDASDILSTIVSRTQYNSIAENPWPDLSSEVDSLSRISLYDLQENYSAVVASYNLTTYSDYTIIEIANALSQVFSYTSADGVPEETLPAKTEGDPVSDEFRVFIVAFYLDNNPGKAFLLATVVRETVYENYVTENSRGVNPGNVVSQNASFSSTTDSFTAQAGSGLADFLFVIDNSGSMGDEQTAISQVATDFQNTIQNSGLDYRIATVTTDSSTLQDNNSDGGITTSLEEFENDVQPGTGGSGTESGIYHAEQALLSVAEGDASDGSLALETNPMPRTNASMNIIMMSDEPEQYYSYAGSEFDIDNNLFVDRGYVVHAIVEPDTEYYDANGKYSDLAGKTGGLEGDINNLNSFSQMIIDISIIAGGTTSSFELAHNPVSETVTVKMDGSTVPRSQNNGWDIPFGSNKIVFFGTYVPEGGENIEVTYTYVSP